MRMTTKHLGNPTREVVLKIQRPMDERYPALIYNQDRDMYAEMPMTDELKSVMGSQYKLYVRAYISSYGLLQISEVLDNQGW